MKPTSRICACCGQAKWVFDMFEEMAPDVGLCYDCTVDVYALRDALQQKDPAAIKETWLALKERMVNTTPAFRDWYKNEFLKQNIQP